MTSARQPGLVRPRAGLDRGELDRIVERAGGGVPQDERRGEYRRRDEHERHYDEDRGHNHDGNLDHDRRSHEDHDDDRYGRPGRKRGGAFSALTGLLCGDDD